MNKILILLLSLFLTQGCTKKSQTTEAVINTYLEGNIPSTDPIHSTNKITSTIVGSIFEGLYHYHYLKRPLTLEPALADGEPKISPDGKTYTIKIKKRVLFQDDPAFPNGKGRELVAQDFIYSWKRLADPSNKASGWWILDGLVAGLNDWRTLKQNDKADYDTPVEGLKALDDHTLVIQLTRRSYQFHHLLATTPATVVAREVVEKYDTDIINHPVGTGPFKMEKWVRNSKFVLVKNPSFRKSFYPTEGTTDSKSRGFLKHGGKQLPLSSKVVLNIFQEKQPLWLSFLKGNLDNGVIPKDNYDQIFQNNKMTPEFANKEIKVLYLPRPDVVYIAFNLEDPFLAKHKKVRQALAQALDKKTLLKKFYNSRGIVAESPIPPGLEPYDKAYKSPNQFNLENAKKLLADAGFPEGKGLPVFNYELSSTSTWSRQFGELLQDMFGKIGVKLKLSLNTWPQFNTKIKTKKATMFDQAWMADYPDSENFMQMFYSKNESPGPNYFNYDSPEYDSLYEKFVSLPPGPERNEINKKMISLINDDVPGIFTIHRNFRLLFHGWLENYNEYPIIYDHLQYYFINKKKKKELSKKL